MNLDALLAEARQARPDNESARPRRWEGLFPVYEVLRTRKLSCAKAVEWLAAKGHVPKGDEGKALKAFHAITHRRNKKARS